MKRIRGGSGIGDAIYVRAVAEHFLRAGERVTVCSDHPDVFAGMDVTVEPFRRIHIDVLAHYTTRKRYPDTTQWADVCISAGIPVEPLSIAWARRSDALVRELRSMAAGRPVVLVHGGRTPMGRTDGFGAELLPERRAFDLVLREFSDCFTVRIGKGKSLYPLAVSLDLTDRTSIQDLFDLAQDCDGVIGQCSYAVPLAEAFDKPLMAVWSAKGMREGRSAYIRQIVPQKILSKESSMFVIDNWSDEQIRDEVRAFRFLR